MSYLQIAPLASRAMAASEKKGIKVNSPQLSQILFYPFPCKGSQFHSCFCCCVQMYPYRLSFYEHLCTHATTLADLKVIRTGVQVFGPCVDVLCRGDKETKHRQCDHSSVGVLNIAHRYCIGSEQQSRRCHDKG